MLRTLKCFRSLWCLSVSLLLTLSHGNQSSQPDQEILFCQPGFYCSEGSYTAVPCPKGTYGPTAEGVTIDSCLKCPTHHYCPRLGLSSFLSCGPEAEQPLSGQDTCICPREGQIFQASDGRCHCAIGYQPTSNGDACIHKLYDICRDGQTRTQYGDCLDRRQWSLHCKHQVCQSAEDYQSFDGELGLCVCKEPPGRAACGGLCRREPTTELKLQCHSSGKLNLVWNEANQVTGFLDNVLNTLFKQWDFQGALLCNSHLTSSRPVYIVQTTGAGFLGLLSGLPKELLKLFSVPSQLDSESSTEKDADFLWEVTKEKGTSHGEANSRSRMGNNNNIQEEEKSLTGVLNPTACLHLGDVILFTVDTHHYPQYDLGSLYNTNRDFDWGAFRQLKEELTLSWTPPSFFSLIFNQPGVYVFTLSSHQHKHLYVRVMPSGAQCYEPGPFFPTTPHHMIRVGIRKRPNLLLRPDWLVAGGLLFGAVVILCFCVTLLILFREYGWPEKKPIRAQYRMLQMAYCMDDYSSRASRVISLRKTHRNQRDSTHKVCSETSDDFWDYEHQVDLEGFNSNTFYRLLLKQSLSVTMRLGQLTTEVKELYQGVLGKLELLHPRQITEDRVGDTYERMRMEVKREVVRRKSLASQLRTLLDSQLQVLRQEQHAQQRVHSVFTEHLRECTRLLSKDYNSNQPSCELQQQNFFQRLVSLLDEMGELISTECHRQGAWGFLGESTGAKLLCPDTGTVLTKEQIFGPDGSLHACQALHFDAVTGLIKANAHIHMLLDSGRTLAVPPDFFIHPQTGRAMPIAGNVAYDPASSTLVFTTDTCTGYNRKWDSPLLPFIPYPTSCKSETLSSTQLRGLRSGQRLQLGVPMADPGTGVPVPILAVTIHPQTGLLCPLGGLHVCPITRISQPIQIGYPMLDPRTGNVFLTVGVSLDPVTGAVLPVGGVLLAESFMEPLSGHMVKAGGASMRAAQLVPHAGGYQALLDSKVLAAMFRVLELLKALTEELGSDQTLRHPLPHQSRSETGSGRQNQLVAVAKELQQAWGRSLHCQLQLQTRLNLLLDWAVDLQQNGGTLGDMPLTGSDLSVPALLGMEYPDPMGSGLSVPVLGSHADPISGIQLPLAGTMQDPEGKGLVAIRYGSQTVDPVTGVLAPVVGARLDVSRKTVVPVTASYWLTVGDQNDSVQVEALQREVCVRNIYWQQQRQREEDVLSDLDTSLFQCLLRATEVNSFQVQWSGGHLKEASIEMQDSAQSEAQRRAARQSHLALILPPHVLHILTKGDEEEWDQQCVWHTEFMSGLEKVDVSIEQLQKEQERWTTQGGERTTTPHATDKELRLRELWEQCCLRQTELDAALNTLHFVRHLSQLRADTAQAILCGTFWYKEYGLLQCCGHIPTTKVMGLLQQKALPMLERLKQLLEDKQPPSCSPNACNQHVSGLSTKQVYGLEIPSRVWTSSVPVVKGFSTLSLREPESQETGLQASSAPTQNSQRHIASSGIHSQESQPVKESQLAHVLVPTIPEEDWSKLLKLSPLFQQLKEVELRVKSWACGAGLLRGELADSGKRFIDVLDAQWECEGELIPLDSSVLNPREFLVYQHGLFLMHTLHNLKLAPAVCLQIATSLPLNNYISNAFRNSFFYQEAEETLFVRRQRLQSVGGFSLLLLHCLSHIKIKDMSSDSSPAFQRIFFKILQACLHDLFQARLGIAPPDQEASLWSWFKKQEFTSADSKATRSDSQGSSLLSRIHKPSRRLLSEIDIEELQKKHRETSLYSHLEELLRERSSEATINCEDQTG